MTRVNHIKEGEAMYRSGIIIFKVQGNRQYWRLQNQAEHEVIDYVVIHFKQ
jgi:hypothetical protein